MPLTVLDVAEPEAVTKYERYALVLIRPDQHIAWRGRSLPRDPGGVVATITATADT